MIGREINIPVSAKSTVLPDEETMMRSLDEAGLLGKNPDADVFYMGLSEALANEKISGWMLFVIFSEAFNRIKEDHLLDPQAIGLVRAYFDEFVTAIVPDQTVAFDAKRVMDQYQKLRMSENLAPAWNKN